MLSIHTKKKIRRLIVIAIRTVTEAAVRTSIGNDDVPKIAIASVRLKIANADVADQRIANVVAARKTKNRERVVQRIVVVAGHVVVVVLVIVSNDQSVMIVAVHVHRFPPKNDRHR